MRQIHTYVSIPLDDVIDEFVETPELGMFAIECMSAMDPKLLAEQSDADPETIAETTAFLRNLADEIDAA